MKEYIFTTDGPIITARVSQTLEALGDQDWQVTLLDSYMKEIAFRVIYAASALEAASEAVDAWLSQNGYNTSFAVSL